MIIIKIFEETSDEGYILAYLLLFLLCIALFFVGGVLAPALITFPAILIQMMTKGVWWAFALLGVSLILGIIGNNYAEKNRWKAKTIVDYAKICGAVLSVVVVLGAVFVLFTLHSDEIMEKVQEFTQLDFGSLWAQFLEYINSLKNVLILVLVVIAAILGVIVAAFLLWMSMTAVVIPFLAFSCAWVGLFFSITKKERKNHIRFLFQYIEWIGHFIIAEVVMFGIYSLLAESGMDIVARLKSANSILAFYYSIPWFFRFILGVICSCIKYGKE